MTNSSALTRFSLAPQYPALPEFRAEIAKRERTTTCACAPDLSDFSSSAARLSRSTINEWMAAHPEFSEAVSRAKAKRLFRDLLAYALKLQKSQAKIDYFATSLPTMLLFDDDLQFRQETTALFLQAQSQLGLGRKAAAKSLLQTVLRRDPNHALAADLSRQL